MRPEKFQVLREDCVKVPQTIGYKFKHDTVTLGDQDEALKKPDTAYMFARYVSGADINMCQEVVCKDPGYAYYFAFNIRGANIKTCQEVACKEPHYAYLFARDIPGADIKLCQEATSESMYWGGLLSIYIKRMC